MRVSLLSILGNLRYLRLSIDCCRDDRKSELMEECDQPCMTILPNISLAITRICSGHGGGVVLPRVVVQPFRAQIIL